MAQLVARLCEGKPEALRRSLKIAFGMEKYLRQSVMPFTTIKEKQIKTK